MSTKDIALESKLTTYLFNKASRSKIPLNGTFELSPVCNFSCKMCYVRKTQFEVDKSIRKITTYEEWIELAKQLKEEGMLYLLLTGGEPLLWPKFWQLYEELSKMGFFISINTNGTLINDFAIEKFRTYPPTRINITLYGSNDSTYESLCGVKNQFSLVDNAITKLKKEGISVKLNCSLTPHNANDLEEIVRYAKNRNLILQIATYMFPSIRRDLLNIGSNDRFTPQEAAYYNLKKYLLQNDEEHYRRYLDRLVKNISDPFDLENQCLEKLDGEIKCRAGNASFWITWDGWLTSCGMMNNPKIELKGRLFKDAWKELVEKTKSIKLSPKCNTCNNRSICHSCAAMALAETGEFRKEPEYLCQMVYEMKKLAYKELKIRF